jgi:hypothetical protein
MLQRTGEQRQLAARPLRQRLVVTLPPPLSFRVAMTSNVKSWSQLVQVMMMRLSLMHRKRRSP